MNRFRIEITGIVQGVGFRPFVYNLASSKGISGYVLNNSKGVTIEAEGKKIEQFINELQRSAPPLARIAEIRTAKLHPVGYRGFEIRESLPEEGLSTLISPDISICDDCLRELFNPTDRRYLYPFINCTNCGPRYSITLDIPYDRPKTTMSAFSLCGECGDEYHDPTNRRFHAQPNACPECGPQLTLTLNSARFTAEDKNNPLKATLNLLKQGAIVAIKGLGGFHLACDATNDRAVKKLRDGKRKSNKPFAIMAPDIRITKQFCEVSKEEQELLLSPMRPIVLLKKKTDISISEVVASQNKYLGVMLPYTPLHYLLLRYPFKFHFTALVMTSGNLSEEPIVIDNEEAVNRLSDIADAFLSHDRGIYMRVDDSVVRRQTLGGRKHVTHIRRARGYAPSPIDLGVYLPQVFAAGGALKTTFCFTKGRHAILSQHLGDMENKEALDFYRETYRNLRKTFKVEPEIIAHDLHPNYWSTQFARELQKALSVSPSSLIPVQHHHAHIVSCMAEYSLKEKVIGIAFDGTGYGTDGKVWGGEFLVADGCDFERYAHLDYVPMPGGEKAIREPYRMALSYLYSTFGDKMHDRFPGFFERFNQKKICSLLSMIKGGINSPMSSSCGRLFDGVSSLLGVRDRITFEGEAAIELEMLTSKEMSRQYPFEIKGPAPSVINVRPMIMDIIDDVNNNVAAGDIAGKFLNTLIEIVAEISGKIREEEGVDRVVLSGGCFQNSLLLRGTFSKLESEGFTVFTNSIVPPNDGGISLGQALIAAHQARS
jgi:hydrogenase maturation protein HypF